MTIQSFTKGRQQSLGNSLVATSIAVLAGTLASGDGNIPSATDAYGKGCLIAGLPTLAMLLKIWATTNQINYNQLQINYKYKLAFAITFPKEEHISKMFLCRSILSERTGVLRKGFRVWGFFCVCGWVFERFNPWKAKLQSGKNEKSSGQSRWYLA